MPAARSASTPGSQGPDRIIRAGYNAASELTSRTSAYGTTEASVEALTYSPNGVNATVKDGEGNLTSYERDGFDRLTIARYPVTTAGANASSGSDYEQLGYDASSNVISRRLRDGQTITYGYDNLDRVTSKVTPGTVHLDWDVAYTYDLLGQLKTATGDGSAVNAFTYDALGRVTNEQNYAAATVHAYDLAGRQTRMTWSDGNYVDYHYKARIYSPALGRSMQTDPTGYADGTNLYSYVSGDPINRIDPTGLSQICWNE